MLLKRIEIRNVRKIKQAEIEFYGKGLQVIQGLNKSGKSTIGQAIALTLGGIKEVTPGIIKLGESKAEVVAYTDDGLKIKTSIQDNGSQKVSQDVSCFNEETNKYIKVSGGVRAFLDSITSNLESPFSIKDWTDEDVIELIKERCGVKEIIEKIDSEIKEIEENRLLLGREKKAKGKPMPVVEVKHGKSIDELIKMKTTVKAKINKKREFYKDIDVKARNEPISNINNLEKLVDMLQQMLPIARELEERDERKCNEEYLNKIDIEIAEWNKNEAMATAYDRYVETLKQVEALDEEYKNLTKKIEEKREKRKKALNGMNLGVAGLEITEDGKLLHNGVLRGITKTNPIGNWSTAQTIQVLFLLGLRFSGKLKIMVIDNAESLDETHTRLISKLAEDNGFLILMLKVGEVPDDLEEGVIYIKDGAIL